MNLKILTCTSRSVTFEIEDGNIYESQEPYEVSLNGVSAACGTRTVQSLYGLMPDSDYTVSVSCGGVSAAVGFHTERETATLNVLDFGASGSGTAADTAFLQAAILCCPEYGRVLVPAGTYLTGPLFLKSGIRLELARGAVLAALTGREHFPVLKGSIPCTDSKEEYNLGTWEGDPKDMYAAIITGVGVENVVIYGEGTIDGRADHENWWKDPKAKQRAARPRTVFLNRCSNVIMEGITVKNSPSWTIHPYFSENLKFLNLKIMNPKVSPNTDGLDPESCRNVEIAGVYFSVGDDCIAVKSGKLYMGARYKTPSENIEIRQCCMRDGHGSVTLGSEMAGGICGLHVHRCLFADTDRGLRIKTRRGRGKDAVIREILFENIRMKGVVTPLVLNAFYYCDPDGHTPYVSTKECLPVDERTPYVGELCFRNIRCEGCHAAAGFFYGLPEQKIESICMEHVRISFADSAVSALPAMMDGIEECSRKGLFIRNAKRVVLKDVRIGGQEGKAFDIENVEDIVLTDGD